MGDVEDWRRFYAELVTAKAEAHDPRLRAAFAAVPREAFLGPGPWQAYAAGGTYVATPAADPRFVYQDLLFALAPERGINNGEPSLHARCLAAVAPAEGDRVLHVGAGSGYYTAILAELVGPSGRVAAYEIDPALARTATGNLADRSTVAVRARSGAEPPLPESDVIYVSAGASRPLDAWLDALAAGGRLIFPLTPARGWGGMLRVMRRDGGYDATFVSRAAFVPCLGGQTAASSQRLEDAFAKGGWQAVRSLVRGDRPPDDGCWLAGRGWWLSTAALP